MPDGSILRFGPYQLDPGKGQFWCDGQTVRLPPKALQVLCYLAERPGQLVTKEELFRVVWVDTVVGDAALTMCIQEIRKALQDNAREPRYVETVHRRGFRFIGTVVNDQLSVVSQTEGVTSQRSGASSQPEETHHVTGNAGLKSEVESFTSNGQGLESNGQGLASKMQSRDSEIQALSFSPDETPEARLRTRDIFVASLSSRFTRIIMLAAGMLVIVTVLTVQYLSLPISSTQHPVQSSQPALPLPDKPSIVVLPFTNMSEDPKQEYFSDGITTAITSSLSRIASLFVIARTSAFMYKEKSVKVQDISREMGVRYVLEGSVQKADQHVRITVQLIDATTGYHLWAEHYDRPLKDIFALQDEIVQKIVTTLKLQLAVVEQSWVMPRHTSNLEAYDAFLRGADQLWRVTPETNAQARQLFEKAIDLDSQYAEAYALLGWVYLLEWNHRWSQDRQNLERAAVLAQQAITLDPSLPVARWLLSACYLQKQQYDQALAESERAITLDRNNSGSYAFQAEVLNFLGRPEEAIQRMEQAMRLEPYHYPANYLWRLGWAYLLAGHYAEAIAAAKEALNRNSNEPAAFIILASSYLRQWGGQQGEDDQTLIQALAAAQRVRSFPATIAVGHRLVGYVYVFQKQYEQALTEMEQALTLAPEDAGSYASLAEVLGRIGRTEEALPMVEEALRRKSPVVADHLLSVGAVYLLAGKPAEAIVPLKQYLIHYPHMLGAQLALAAAYSELGQTDAAARAVAEALRINPQFSLEVHKERMPIEDPATVERVIAALRKAGLK